MSCKCNPSFSDIIQMELNIVAVYDLRMCMKEDNPSLNYFKGDDLLRMRLPS